MALSMWAMTTLIAPVAGPIRAAGFRTTFRGRGFSTSHSGGGNRRRGHVDDFRNRDSAIRKAPIDGVGLGLLIVWMGSLQVMLDKGKDLDWFSSTTVVVLALVAVIALAFFLVWELTADIRWSTCRSFEAQLYGRHDALSVGYGLYFGNLVLLPLWLQTDIGYTATEAGLVMAPVGLFAVLLSPITGKILPVPIRAISLRCRSSFSRCVSGCARVIRPASTPIRC